MILKVGDNYIADVDVENEKNLKLLDDIAGISGDYSYSFEIPNTAEIRNRLGVSSFTQTNKLIYQRQSATLEYNGVPIYTGFIRVEGITSTITLSFFSGNSSWIRELDAVNIRTINMGSYDVDNVNASNILASMVETEGVVFPIVDKGVLSTRVSKYISNEDFHPFIFVKDIFKAIAKDTGIKITGDLLKDGNFNSLITSNNSIRGLQKEIDDRSIYAVSQTDLTVSYSTWETVFFSGTLIRPYYNSPNNNWNIVTGRYTVDIDIKKLDVEVKIIIVGLYKYRFLINGTDSVEETTALNQTSKIHTLTNLSDGDYFELQVYISPIGIGPNTVYRNSTIRVTPRKFTKVFAKALLPDQTCSSFIAGVFKLFNVISSYDNNTKSINTVLFKDIKEKDEIDLSNYVSDVIEENFVDTASDYGRNTLLVYSQQSNNDIDDYNNKNSLEYGNGIISVNNDFLEEQVELFNLDFVSTVQKSVPMMGTKLPSLGFCEIEDTDETRSITSVSDYGDGTARFNFTGSSVSAGILVKISGATESAYNGEYKTFVSGSGFVTLYDCYYIGTATATLTVIEINDIDNDDQVILLYQKSTLFTQWNGNTEIQISTGGNKITGSFAYFYLPKLGFPIEDGPQQCALYFDPVNESTFQEGIKSFYYDITERILNDPGLASFKMTLPLNIFINLGLNPIRINIGSMNCLFLLSRISGYKGSDCEVELIKLP